ncbi:MAG: bacterio-opsin activator domain-containing protein [Halobacteriales archaeon]
MEVLLLDDDPDWLKLTARLLEEKASQLTVHTAASVSEGFEIFEEEAIECVVSDYHMPEADGIEVLDRIRERDDKLPFILITGKGSESIASEAISAEVTDYLIKDPRRDQSRILSNRITTAIENYRTEIALRESEERYRSVVEQSRDMIGIYRDGQLVFVNDAATTITGYDKETLREMDPFETLLHPDDRADVEALESEWRDTDGEVSGSFDARIVRRDDSIRDCEFSVSSIRYEQQRAILLSVRDITERKRREEVLQNERDIRESIRKILVETTSREELERGFCEQIIESGNFDLAWIGNRTISEQLKPSTIVGENQDYLQQIDLNSETNATEPSRRTIENRRIHHVDWIDPDGEGWEAVATECGFRSAIALPIEYSGILYGVLAVYSTDTDVFDTQRTSLLEGLAESLASSINAAEQRLALTAEEVVRLDIGVSGTETPLFRFATASTANDPDGQIEVLGTVAHNDTPTLTYVRVPKNAIPDDFDPTTLFDDTVATVKRIEETELSVRYELTIHVPTIGSILTDYGAVIQSFRIGADGAELTIDVPHQTEVTRVLDSLDEHYPAVELLSRREMVSPDDTQERYEAIREDLTEKQWQAVTAAYHSGYFEQPRDRSAAEVAESLDISRSTFLQHLRAAEKKIIGGLTELA